MTLARRYVPAFLEARQGAAEIVPHLGPRRPPPGGRGPHRAPDRRAERPAHGHPLRRHTQSLRGPGAAPRRPGTRGHGLDRPDTGGKRGVVGFSASPVAHLHECAYRVG
jgi:hypothetical protein